MREFVTAVTEAHDAEPPEKGEPIKLHDVECSRTTDPDAACDKLPLCQVLTYFKPTDGQYMVFMAATGRHASETDRMGATIDFFVGLFDKAGQTYLVNRLLDRDDPFGGDNVTEIMGAITEDWTGRPTQPPSASSRSRTSGGRRSTARTPVST